MTICCGWRWHMSSERWTTRWLLACWLAATACADLQRSRPLGEAGAGGAAAGGASDGSIADASLPSADLGARDAPAALSFARDVHPLLVELCARCHSAGGQASRSALVLSSEPARDLAQVAKLVNQDNPPGSRLLSKAVGTGHEGGTVLQAGTPGYRSILAWITEGSLP